MLVPVLISLDYQPVASYTGDVPGLAATSPSVTGQRLGAGSAAERAYERHVARIEEAFADALRAAVPEAAITSSLRTVYGGVAATVPADRVADIRRLPHVVDVQPDRVHQRHDPDRTATDAGA